MDKGKAKSTDNPSEKLTDLLVDDSQNARVIDSVESEGFRRLRAALQPKFTLPSRQTVTRDIMKLYAQEKSSLMSKLKGRRICLTSDTWTSVQNVNYMSLTAHYIDCDWVYNKRILNFCIVESHKGEALGKTVEACLINWGIQSIFTISLDNASANNLLVAHLKKRTMDWNDIFCEHEFIHVRCAAHILNLVVADGLKEISDSVEKIRNVVRNGSSSSSAANGNDLDCVTIDDLPKSWGSLEAEFKMQLQLETCAKEAKTELQQHLEDACIVEGDKFDILTWWKINSCRYPIVSQMAMQVLAVPVTTVASEACFSTGGRVLDVFRSSLSPNHVEALVCTQNWIKGTILGAAESKKATEETSAHNEYIANIEELGIELAAKATID